MKQKKKDIERLSNEQLSALFSPAPRDKRGWSERRRDAGFIFVGLPAIAFVLWLLLT